MVVGARALQLFVQLQLLIVSGLRGERCLDIDIDYTCAFLDNVANLTPCAPPTFSYAATNVSIATYSCSVTFSGIACWPGDCSGTYYSFTNGTASSLLQAPPGLMCSGGALVAADYTHCGQARRCFTTAQGVPQGAAPCPANWTIYSGSNCTVCANGTNGNSTYTTYDYGNWTYGASWLDFSVSNVVSMAVSSVSYEVQNLLYYGYGSNMTMGYANMSFYNSSSGSAFGGGPGGLHGGPPPSRSGTPSRSWSSSHTPTRSKTPSSTLTPVSISSTPTSPPTKSGTRSATPSRTSSATLVSHTSTPTQSATWVSHTNTPSSTSTRSCVSPALQFLITESTHTIDRTYVNVAR